MDSRPTLKRSLTLPVITLYGLGTTVGAGIYVLVGKVAATAISVGAAGYLMVFLDYPKGAVIAALVLLLGAVAIWASWNPR